MTDDSHLWLAVSGWLAWFLKEVIALVIRRSELRTGRHGIIEGRAGIVCDAEVDEGGTVLLDYFPAMEGYSQYSRCRNIRVQVDCQLFNDSDTQSVYMRPTIEIWGVEGLRMNYRNPHLLEFDDDADVWRDTPSISVPAHSITRLRLIMPLGIDFAKAQEEIWDYYEGAVLLLRLETIEGKAREFRVCTSSFAGSDRVVWPQRCRYPIFNHLPTNEDGRKAGRRPQKRKSSRRRKRVKSELAS